MAWESPIAVASGSGPGCPRLPQLSRAARSLWGKSDYGEGRLWLPLHVHMDDSAFVAGRLWDEWVPQGTKEVVRRALGNDAGLARGAFVFLAAAHDIGKATPAFQGMRTSFGEDDDCEGLRWKPEHAGLHFPLHLQDSRKVPAARHPVAGQRILERILSEDMGHAMHVVESWASVVGGHHGTPPDLGALTGSKGIAESLGFDETAGWRGVQRELVKRCLTLAGLGESERTSLFSRFLPAPAAGLLTGLVIMTDWIASNQGLFPLIPILASDLDDASSAERCERAWTELDILPCWQEPEEGVMGEAGQFFSSRFRLPDGARPRPVQEAALDLARTAEDPGLLVIEAPMGEGKTEAALAAAEVLAARTGRGGVCVALPTMATTDAMFGRVHAWLDRLPQPEGGIARSIYLAHGKARLNEEFNGIARVSAARFGSIGQDLDDDGPARPEGAVVSDWMCGRKRGMLANFVVCTVDQVLMGALQMKHLALRQLALANKVVIVDECHAYDAYMRQYLCRVLEWLGAWRTPVILMSATLPDDQRREIVEAYLRGRKASSLPADGTSSRPRGSFGRVARRRDDLPESPASTVSEGGSQAIPTEGEGAYPLLTYTTGDGCRSRQVGSSARHVEVDVRIVGDDESGLVDLLAERLADGGCAGVVCDTVGRAQRAAHALADRFGTEHVILTHARFVDVDRMDNEQRIRGMLGPQATRENGKRPELCIVVGTQVLEQSLDIDFDVLVTDVAPVDLVLQRLGRMHRHRRGEGEALRSAGLRSPTCYLRGIADWGPDGPLFAPGVKSVYEEAALLEFLAACGLCESMAAAKVVLPGDIAPLVRLAYGKGISAKVPVGWSERYADACETRAKHGKTKRSRAQACLLRSANAMCAHEDSLVGWYSDHLARKGSAIVGQDADRGPRAVRDTQETVEVMLLVERDGDVRLLPWVGDARHGVETGAVVPTHVVPGPSVARVAAQSTVRLPVSLCRPERLDELISELEGRCASKVGAWQMSPWLEGQLALFLHEDSLGGFETELCGRRVRYTRGEGLSVESLV